VPFAEPRFTVQAQEVDAGTALIVVTGEIHVSSAPRFSGLLQASIDEGRTALVLDLTDVEFIDSTGLGVLLDTLRRLRRIGGHLALVCTNPTVVRLFVVTGLDETLGLQPTVASALEAVQAAGGRTAGAP